MLGAEPSVFLCSSAALPLSSSLPLASLLFDDDEEEDEEEASPSEKNN